MHNFNTTSDEKNCSSLQHFFVPIFFTLCVCVLLKYQHKLRYIQLKNEKKALIRFY